MFWVFFVEVSFDGVLLNILLNTRTSCFFLASGDQLLSHQSSVVDHILVHTKGRPNIGSVDGQKGQSLAGSVPFAIQYLNDQMKESAVTRKSFQCSYIFKIAGKKKITIAVS